jgi:hypothetical protein
MEPTSRKDFLKWTKSKEITFDPSQPPEYLPARDYERFWNQPVRSTGIANLIGTILGELPAWDSCYLWPRSGSWTPSAGSCADSVMSTIYRGAGIPANWEGALRATRNDFSSIVSILFSYAAFGWSVSEDIYFIPDHGRAIVTVDHHDVVWVSFRHESDLSPFIVRMHAAEFELPTKVPDSSFKHPSWMPTGGA